MYVFWWRKPHNVRQPISLSPRLLDDDACLYLHYLANIEPTFVFRGRPSPPTRVKTLSIAPQHRPKTKTELKVNNNSLIRYFKFEINGEMITYSYQARDTLQKSPDPVPTIESAVLLDSDTDPHKILRFPDCKNPNGLQLIDDITNQVSISTSAFLTRNDPLNAKHLHKILFDRMEETTIKRLSAMHTSGFKHTLPVSVHSASITTYKSKLNYVNLYSLLCLLYSLIHTGAWNWSFPTRIEIFLWRLSCCLMLLANLVFIIIHLIVWVLIRAKKKTATGPRAEKLEHTNTYLRNITKVCSLIYSTL